MLKRVDFRRDLLTIFYFVLLFAGIGMFFGNGSLTYFIGMLHDLYPLDGVFVKMKELIMSAISEGSLGTTRNFESFESVVQDFFKRSLPIIVTAFVAAIPLGLAKGIFDFRNKKGALAPIGNGLTSLITSLPDFFVIIALQWIILYNFRFIDWFGNDQWYNFILPSIMVSLYPLMYFARITSASLSNEEGEMYIQTARAMGLTDELVIKKHILKKCLVSIFQHIPVVMTYVLSNLLMVEWLLDYKGAAWRFLYAIQRIQVPKSNELGLAVEFSMCFMLILFVSQILSTLWQHNYQVEKKNPLVQILTIFIRYCFISVCIVFILICVSMAPPE
ncbi:ABC transporter permease subunit [Bacillus sp. JJ1122]|uniref:ABC transporter permease subunit n=1 Tax=Bacillus sp. JJ1122 TaxID=3122951 RepID=UPI002FFDABF3